MEEKVGCSRYKTVFFLLAVAAFCVLIYAIFINYGTMINERFIHMEKENLTSYGRSQSIRISEDLTLMRRRLKYVAEFAGASSFDPESEEFRRYLSSVNGDPSYPVEYIPAGAWEEQAKGTDMRQEEREFYRQLLDGEAGVSNLIQSEGGGPLFFIGEPVVREGELVGVVRCTVKVEELMRHLEQYTAVKGDMISCLSDKNGQILYCSDDPEWKGKNIADMLRRTHGAGEGIESFITAVRDNLSITLNMDIDSESVFLTNIPVGMKGWNMMSFSEANLMKDVSSRLLDDTIMMGLSLVGITLLAGIFIYVIMAESRRRIKLEQERYAVLSNFSDTVLFEYNCKTDVLQLTRNATRLLGIGRHCLGNFRHLSNGLIHSDDAKEAFRAIANVRAKGEQNVMELRLLGKDGGYIWCECRMQPINRDKDIIIGKLTDITGLKAKEMNLLSLNSTDTLTGLMNREAFIEKVEELIEKKPKGFFFMIDVDNFKAINDTKGHEAGDGCLADLGELLRQSFRDYDPVARIGGDEFAAFMSDTSDVENAQKKAELILSKMGNSQAQEEVKMSVSIGIAACPDDGLTYQELYRNADHAMYLAKREGKNRFVRNEKV